MTEMIFSSEQKKHLLWELSYIAPRWAKVLLNHDGSTMLKRPDGRLDIIDDQYCIAGEAHGFTDNYVQGELEYCSLCDEYSIKMANIGLSDVVNNEKTFDDDKISPRDASYNALKSFIYHFNNVHKGFD